MSAAYMAVEIINSEKNIKFDCVDTWNFVLSQTEIPEHMFDDLAAFLSSFDVFLLCLV